MKLSVGNLSTYASELDLKKLFSSFGDVVSVTIAYDSFNRRSRGMAIVEMETESSAWAAIRILHNAVFMDRALIVRQSPA
jgi:multiple RNA-binding domain-containing protein 1